MNEKKEMSWGKLIIGSAIGTVLGYIAILVMCFCCYFLLIAVFFAGSAPKINTGAIFNEIGTLNSVSK